MARRDSSANPGAGEASPRRTATLACATFALALTLPACASDDGNGVALPPASDLSEIRALNLGELNLAGRPASCERTRAVLIIAGKPHPRKLTLPRGTCLVWGNTASDTPVTARFIARPARRTPGKFPLGRFLRLPPRFATTTRGPLEGLSRREAFKATGGAIAPFSYNSDSGTGSERATLAFHPARARRRALRCPSRALRGPAAKLPIKLTYAITPGGAKGTLILDRSRRASKPRPMPRGLQDVARLDCGKLTIADRPAGCKATRAVLIAARKPRPRELKLPRGGCVIWGNNDGAEARLEFNRTSSPDPAINHRRLWPRATVAWDFFFRDSPGEIPYTIRPGGTKGTIVLD